MELLLSFVQLIGVLLLLGLATERGTQLVKEFLRGLSRWIPVLNFQDRRSFILAAAVAFFVSYFFGVDVSQYLTLLDGFDPELIKLVNALLLMFTSNAVHDKFFQVSAVG